MPKWSPSSGDPGTPAELWVRVIFFVVSPVADPRDTTRAPAAEAPLTDLYGAPIARSRWPSPLKSSAYLAGAADAGVTVTAVNRPPVNAVTVAAATTVRKG